MKTLKLLMFLFLFLFFGSTVYSQQNKITGLKLVGTVNYPHGWGVDFVKVNNYIYQTKSESNFKLAAIDASSPDRMQIISEIEGGKYAARNMAIYRNILLLNLYQKFMPVDISNPGKPEELEKYEWQPDEYQDRIHPFYRFEFKDDHLFLACGNLNRALRVYKVSPPFSPELLGCIDLEGYINEKEKTVLSKTWYPNAEMVFIDKYLLVTYGNLLVVFDVSDYRKVSAIALYKTEEFIESITVNKNILYLAMSGRKGVEIAPGKAKIIVLDIKNPQKINKIGEYKDIEIPERILADGSRLFCAGWEKISEDEKISNRLTMTEGLKSLFKYKTAIYIFDISEAGNLKMVKKTYLPLNHSTYFDSCCRKIIYENGLLYVADHYYGTRVFDVKNDSLTEIGHLRTITRETNNMVMTGDYIYMAGNSLIPVNIKDITKPFYRTETIINCPGGPYGDQNFQVSKSPYIYLISLAYKEIIVVDVSRPDKPIIINLVKLPENVLWYFMNQINGFIYVVGNGENDLKGSIAVAVFKPVNNGKDLSPVHRLILTPDLSPDEKTVALLQRGGITDKNYLYILGYAIYKKEAEEKPGEATAIFTVDVSSPDLPKVIGKSTIDRLIPCGAHYYGGPGIYNNYLLFWTHKGKNPDDVMYLCAVDIKNPEKPVPVSKTCFEDPSFVQYTYSGRALILNPYPYLLIQEYYQGLRLLDISDIKSPKVIWREEKRENQKFENYGSYGWGGMLFDGRYIYAGRLDHLDIFVPVFSEK